MCNLPFMNEKYSCNWFVGRNDKKKLILIDSFEKPIILYKLIFYNNQKTTIMKMQLKLMLLLLGVSFISFMGCKKHEDEHAITIVVTHTTFVKPIVLTGTFVATGEINISGASLMDVHPVGDSAHCTQTMTTKEGSFTMHQDCSTMNMSGSWYITSGTGRYTHLQGKGTLTMMFPPNVPTGVLGIDTLTGEVW